jgi:hypothetical protein
MPIVKSQKGSDLLEHEGYLYRQDRNNLNTKNWRCQQDKKYKCKARAVTPLDYEGIEDENIRLKGEHSHPPDPAEVGKRKLHASLKEAATANADPPRAVVAESLADVDEEVAARVRSNTNLANVVRRKRRAVDAFPPAPHQRMGFNIPPNLRTNLIVDTGREDPQRILIFGSLRPLVTNSSWFADGTFKISPEIFYQVYTIHAQIQSSIVPTIFALLPNKQERTYDRMWHELKELEPSLEPTVLMTDFEMAAINSAKTAFPDIQTKGCYFHLGQSLWRKVQDLGLREIYLNNVEVRIATKMLLALAFIQPARVPEVFVQISDDAPAELNEVYSYFEDTYIGRRRGRRRLAPLFSIEMWNMHERQENGLARTNNSLEGWHRAFQGSVSFSHPTLWKLVNLLDKEIGYQRARVAQIRTGNDVDQHRREYVEVNRRITRLFESWKRREMTDVEFLRGISHNIEVNV